MTAFLKNPFKRRVKLITHSGSFHADEVFATACLKIFYRKTEKRGVRIIRTRDPKIFDQCNRVSKPEDSQEVVDTNLAVIYDIGGIYDPTQNRYDHHQKNGAGQRKNGVPYSAFGLIWKHFGIKLTSSAEIHQDIDDKFVVQICAGDTAFVDFKIEDTDWRAWTFNQVVGLFRPYGSGSKKDFDKEFRKLVIAAEQILIRIITRTEKKFNDAQKIEKIYNAALDKRVIILDEDLSWKKFLVTKPEPLFVIFPIESETGEIQYCVRAVPINDDFFENRRLLMSDWRGLAGCELQQTTGIKTAVFVHNSGFMGITKTLEDAKLMAERSL